MSTSKLISFPGQDVWTRKICGWSQIQDSGEKRLLASVLSLAISDERKARPDFFDIKNRVGFFGNPFGAYCQSLDIDPNFLIRKIFQAAEAVGCEAALFVGQDDSEFDSPTEQNPKKRARLTGRGNSA